MLADSVMGDVFPKDSWSVDLIDTVVKPPMDIDGLGERRCRFSGPVFELICEIRLLDFADWPRRVWALRYCSLLRAIDLFGGQSRW
jgi:hypothetical protein